ncbi:hypothetical protein M404DRAFT_942468 [Pisolithus tinctorius Marx 270]|uniref:Uncharacterized protein n=1 Tax=Pisolithus tinctorius Marx 270 TaxID=870435 RepID=A0A0C3JDB5_PISTI|nr:hypothetical protein M404DRAFT_942468 [Pisolithus tinctorius Marx 270]
MRYRDELPAGPVPVPVVQVPDEQNVLEAPGNEYYDPDNHMETGSDGNSLQSDSPLYRTVQNNYGLFREYASGFPTYDPESGAHIEQLCDGRATQDSGEDGEPWNARFSHSLKQLRKNYFTPFLNATVWRLMSWFYNGSTQKSQSDLDNLVHNVILAADFDREDLRSFVAQ